MNAVLTDDIMYQAILDKDTSFEGTFFTAVKTTKIFCRPSCTARKPKRENVEFFKSPEEAMQHGYRACKVCRPLDDASYKTPEGIKLLLEKIHKDPSLKISEAELKAQKLDPNTVRRWFLKHHGITFHDYQRSLRINSAFKKIQKGDMITPTAFDSGYESLSGFNDSFKSVFGVSPRKSKEQGVIDMDRIETPLGPMIVCGTEQGICLLEFTDRKHLEREFKHLSKLLNAKIIQGTNKHFASLKKQLEEYFKGQRKEFTVPLYYPGTEFQQRVWDALLKIPYGSTRSYLEQSAVLKRPEAVRAVANANGMNRIAIVVPCHRVIGSDGSLTGYAAGLSRKKWLLDFERDNA